MMEPMKARAPQLLEAQLDLLDEQVEDWRNDHELAMVCRNIEDLIALALETLDRIRKRCDQYNAATGAAPEPEAQILLHYWRRWHDISLRALKEESAIEAQGFRPDRVGEFRLAINEASIAVKSDHVMAAHRRLDAGGGRTLEEIEKELSHQAG